MVVRLVRLLSTQRLSVIMTSHGLHTHPDVAGCHVLVLSCLVSSTPAYATGMLCSVPTVTEPAVVVLSCRLCNAAELAMLLNVCLPFGGNSQAAPSCS